MIYPVMHHAVAILVQGWDLLFVDFISQSEIGGHTPSTMVDQVRLSRAITRIIRHERRGVAVESHMLLGLLQQKNHKYRDLAHASLLETCMTMIADTRAGGRNDYRFGVERQPDCRIVISIMDWVEAEHKIKRLRGGIPYVSDSNQRHPRRRMG